ncbi:MAG: hypothetical protein ACFFDN_35475, partial [Candidatus Hodarchaeota archaeon]
YIGEARMVAANKPLHEDIRSIGLFLKDYDIEGDRISIIVLRENYQYWKQHLILASTYIAKPGVREHYIDQKSDIDIRTMAAHYKAVIGWSDDLDHVRDELQLYFGNLTIYPQDTLFRGKHNLTSIELWLKNQ